MNALEHYSEAERLLDLAERVIPDDEPGQTAVTRRAIAHAHLAATALMFTDGSPEVDPAEIGRVPR